ncbi:hypothetical protein LTR04_003123 [Oleoguttula sp. CCFEE 6159]|nr:hypothetical protein LTR04_003123 [Oleoguttula sp. CCFEE 6159]
MATSTHLDESVTSLLSKSFANASSETDPVKLSAAIYPEAHYTEPEKTEINQWLITSSHIASSSEDQAKATERLSSLNTHLSTRTTLLGSKPSIADIALYARLAPVVRNWSSEERTGEQGYHHIVRHLDFVQNAPLFGLKLGDDERVLVNTDEVVCAIKPIDAKAEKERKKKEKEAAAAATAAGATDTGAAPADEEVVQPQGGRKSKKDKPAEKSSSTGDKIAAAVGAETAGVAQPSAGAAPTTADAPTKTQKKEKKEKAPKAAKPAAVEKPLSPCLIDLRVGHILKAIQHPNADSLYVSTIACGDAADADNTSEHEGQVVRTVCSGLNGLVPLADMQGRRVVVVCNLKPVTMRGIKSAAMVLAASPRLEHGDDDAHKGPVELVNPPPGAQAGERVFFEGWEGEPEATLNPKKKVWETLQPGFTTTEALEVAFEAGAVEALKAEGKTGAGKLRTKGGVCTVSTLKGATVR